jgi:hypothetical protein
MLASSRILKVFNSNAWPSVVDGAFLVVITSGFNIGESMTGDSLAGKLPGESKDCVFEVGEIGETLGRWDDGGK